MRDGYYKVAVGKFDLQLADHPEQLHFPLADADVVKVIPVVSGAGGRGIGAALLGAALITTAVFTGGSTLALGIGGFSGGVGISAAVGNLGLALTLGGIAQMITPVPKQPEFGEADPRGGFAFSGLENVSQEGVPVPVVYGEMIVGSVVLSTGLVAHIIDEAD